jgi:hypothetical protein
MKFAGLSLGVAVIITVTQLGRRDNIGRGFRQPRRDWQAQAGCRGGSATRARRLGRRFDSAQLQGPGARRVGRAGPSRADSASLSPRRSRRGLAEGTVFGSGGFAKLRLVARPELEAPITGLQVPSLSLASGWALRHPAAGTRQAGQPEATSTVTGWPTGSGRAPPTGSG